MNKPTPKPTPPRPPLFKKRTQRARDLTMLEELLACEELKADERAAFANMLAELTNIRGAHFENTLTLKQQAWCAARHEALIPKYENLVSDGKVPRGAEVRSMVGPLPKKPPPMPSHANKRHVPRDETPFAPAFLDKPGSDE